MSSGLSQMSTSTPPASGNPRERGAHFQGVPLREQLAHAEVHPLARHARSTLPAIGSIGFGGSASVDSTSSPTSPNGPTRRHSEHRAASQGQTAAFSSFYTLGSGSSQTTSGSNNPGALGPIRGIAPLGPLAALAQGQGHGVYTNAFGISGSSSGSPYAQRRGSTAFETSVHSSTHPLSTLKRGSSILDGAETPIGGGASYIIQSQLPVLRRRDYSAPREMDDVLNGSSNGSDTNSSSNTKARSQTMMGVEGSLNSTQRRDITPDQKNNALLATFDVHQKDGNQSIDGLTSGHDDPLPNSSYIHTGFSHPLGIGSTRSGSTGTDTYYDASISRRNTAIALDPRRVSVVAVPPMDTLLSCNECSLKVTDTMPSKPLNVDLAEVDSPYNFGEQVTSPSPAGDSPSAQLVTPSLSPPLAAEGRAVDEDTQSPRKEVSYSCDATTEKIGAPATKPLPTYSPIFQNTVIAAEKLLSPNRPITPKYGDVLTVHPYTGEPQRAPSLFESFGGQPLSVRQYAQRLSVMSDTYHDADGAQTHRSRAISINDSLRRRSSVGLHMRPQEALSGAKAAEMYAACKDGQPMAQMRDWLGKQDTASLIEEIAKLRVLAFGAQRGMEPLMTATAFTDLNSLPQPAQQLPYFGPRVSVSQAGAPLLAATGNQLLVPGIGPTRSRANSQQNARVVSPNSTPSFHPNPHGLIQHQHSKQQALGAAPTVAKKNDSEDFFVDINDYMVVDEIGSGQYGTVVLAARSDTERRFAIKIIPKTRLRKKFLPRKASTGQSVESAPLPHTHTTDLPTFTAPSSLKPALAEVPDMVAQHSSGPLRTPGTLNTSVSILSPFVGDSTLGERPELNWSTSVPSRPQDTLRKASAPKSVHIGVTNAPSSSVSDQKEEEDEEDWGSTPNLGFQNNAISLFCGANTADYSKVNALNLRNKRLPIPEEEASEAPSEESISLRVSGALSGGILVSQIKVTDRTGSLQSPTGGKRNRSVQITAPAEGSTQQRQSAQGLPGFSMHRPSTEANAVQGSKLALRACSPTSSSALNAPSNANTPRVFETNEVLRQEISIMRQLRHRNIVPLEEVIDLPDDENVYLVMPYIEKGPIVTLHDNCCHPLEIDMVRTYVRQLLQAISYLHKRHIVHCDIKPDNILIGDNGCVYLVDFGVSEMFSVSPEDGPALDATPRHLENCPSEDHPGSSDSSTPSSITAQPPGSSVAAVKRISVTTSVVPKCSPRGHHSGNHRVSLQYEHGFSLRHSKCSPAFAAPESLTGEQFNGAKADMWSVGITMYVLLFGRTPYTSERAYDVFKQIAEEPIEYTAPLSPEMRSKAKSLIGIANASNSIALSVMRDDDDALEEAAVAMEQTCALQAAVCLAGLLTKAPPNPSEESLEDKGLLSRADLTSLGFDAEHGLVKKYSAALSLLVNLLDRDSAIRFSARKSLEHPFFGRSAFQQLRGLRQRANSNQSQTTDPPSVADGPMSAASLHHSTSSSNPPRSIATTTARI